MIRFCTFVLLCLTVSPVVAADRSPDQWLEWFAKKWDESKWGPNKRRGYMRPVADAGWRARMLALQGLVKHGKSAVKPLTKALEKGDLPTRILSAQALSFLAPHVPRAPLLAAALKADSAPVRLYGVDALGMQGLGKLGPLLSKRSKQERNRDVRQHIGYALERKVAGVDPAIVQQLVKWDTKKIGTAKVGQLAPDFQATTLAGKKFRLSDLRGKKSVVLVFVYGDT